MKIIKLLTFSLFFTLSISATEFTISSYNCGGLTDHYDYLRAVSMQKVMQERYNNEPSKMALNEKIQRIALKILFSKNPQEKLAAEAEWNDNNYQEIFEILTAAPTEAGSPNALWNQKVEETITSYKIRPIYIYDKEASQMLNDHLNDLTHGDSGERNNLLQEARAKMAQRIFTHHLKYDILCLQEADYLNPSLFPEHYDVKFSDTSHSVNGVAWNRERFELIETIGNFLGRAFLVKLKDKKTDKTIVVASGHISGCNPYKVEKNDSAKGDLELKALIERLESSEADIQVIGMDSNVTSLHPRLHLLKDFGFLLDYQNFLEPTCTNPHQVLNTRIDWIAVKNSELNEMLIENIPTLNVGLNSMQTNISDHKPVAAKITY